MSKSLKNSFFPFKPPSTRVRSLYEHRATIITRANKTMLRISLKILRFIKFIFGTIWLLFPICSNLIFFSRGYIFPVRSVQNFLPPMKSIFPYGISHSFVCESSLIFWRFSVFINTPIFRLSICRLCEARKIVFMRNAFRSLVGKKAYAKRVCTGNRANIR